jgi:acylphosphatase
MSEDIEALNVIISGKVQGVFFRSSMKRVADERNVVGWVRNLDDGRVEAIIQGKAYDVAKVLEWCKIGPPRSFVSDVAATKLRIEKQLRYFSIVY